MLIFSSRKSGDVAIEDLHGTITFGEGEFGVRDAVRHALDGGAKKILLNFAGVTAIDSSGVGALVGSHVESQNRGAKLKLEQLPMKVRDVLMMTKLITVFEIYETEDQAIKSFA